MLATIPSATVFGVDGRPIRVEVHVTTGLPGFTLVGLPDASCREARDRVRSAVQSSTYDWPLRRITVNLAPSGTRKAGSGLDLAIAIGVLVASQQLPPEAVAGLGFLGELGLDGAVRAVPGVVPMVDAIEAETVVVPVASGREAALVEGPKVRTVRHLRELVEALAGREPWADHDLPPAPPPPPAPLDLADVRGQEVARYALELAAAGGHHLLFVGPPGAGKTMLARRITGLLPPLEHEQAMEATRVHSAAGVALPGGSLVEQPPFRAPHHTATMVSLIGGGTDTMRPGEISLAANGTLFLDELGEFPAVVLDALRQPLEEGVIRVSRARFTITLPAHFLLLAAMNPCPCGEAGRPGGCRCSERARERYRRRLSGPLLDRFDLRVDVCRPGVDELLGGRAGEPTEAVRARVLRARERMRARGVRCNAELSAARLEKVTPLADDAAQLLEAALRRGSLSARGLARVRRVARTIADLQDADDGPLTAGHVGMALELRADLGPSRSLVA